MNTETKHWHTTFFDSAKTVGECSCALSRLAGAFEMTGNQKVADDLRDISDSLKWEADNIRQAVSEKSRNDLKQAEQTTRSILCATLAGVKIGEKHLTP